MTLSHQVSDFAKFWDSEVPRFGEAVRLLVYRLCRLVSHDQLALTNRMPKAGTHTMQRYRVS